MINKKRVEEMNEKLMKIAQIKAMFEEHSISIHKKLMCQNFSHEGEILSIVSEGFDSDLDARIENFNVYFHDQIEKARNNLQDKVAEICSSRHKTIRTASSVRDLLL